MSLRTGATAPGAAGDRRYGSARGRQRRPLVVAGLLAGVWLIPIAAQALRADWLLLLALLLGTGSVLRAGYYLLDRLMLAGILLTGTLITGGLLFSFWPWGLEPVPVAGTLLTILVAVGALTGRRPQLPLRFRGTDAIIVGASAFAAWMMLGPVAGRSFSGRLPYMTGQEDKYAHFALFDAIHRLNGYTFLHPARATPLVTASTAHVYPQGSHYLYAILDIFLRSAVSPGPTSAEFSRYFTYTLIGYGFLVLAVTWSARWVAGPAMTGWRSAFVCSAVATFVTLGPFTGLVRLAFDSETIGLALLALSAAVLARPAGRPREQMLVAASAMIGVWYAYNLYGALAVLGLIPAVVVYRRRLRRHWLFAAATAGITAAVALLPSVLAELSGFSANRQLAIGGAIIPLNGYLLGGVALLAGASMTVRAGRRSGAWRVQAAHVALAAVAVAVLGLYQQQILSSAADYYFAKFLTGGLVICLVGFGAAGLLLEAAGNRASVARPVRRRAQPLGSIAAILAAAILAGGLLLALPGVRNGHSAYTEAWAYRWWSGRERAAPGFALQAVDHAHLLAGGRPTLIIYTNAGHENWRASFFAAVLNRDLGTTKPTFAPLLTATPLMAIDRRGYLRTAIFHETQAIERAIAGGPRDLQVIVSGRGIAGRLRAFATAHPGLNLAVIYLPRMRPARPGRKPVRPTGISAAGRLSRRDVWPG